MFKLKKKKAIPTLLVILFGLFDLGRMSYESGTFLSLIFYAGMASIGGVSAIYVLLKNPKKIHLKIFIVLYTIITASALYTGNYRIQEFYMPFMYGGMGLLLLNYKLDYTLIKISFMFYLIFFLFHMPKGINYRIFPGYSRNYYSVIMIYHCVLLYITGVENKIRIRLLPALATFIISVWAIGRGGIITSGILLTVVLIEYIKNDYYLANHNRSFILRIQGLVFLLMILGLYIFFFASNDILYKYFERLATHGVTDRSRVIILEKYIYLLRTSFWNILFGGPIRNNYFSEVWNTNLHNSFARLHAFYGLLGVITLVKLLIGFVRNHWRRNKFYIALFCIMLLRMSTDSIAFNGMFDPLIYYFLLNHYFKRERGDLIEKSSEKNNI